MTPGERAVRLTAVAGAAALIAGSVTGTQLTLQDPVWPERGGIKGLVQACALFTAYAFAVALAAGAILSVTLSPLMARGSADGPLACLIAGLLAGLAVHAAVDLAIGERVDSAGDLLGGALAGAAAGPLWWFLVQRHCKKASPHG